MVVPTCGREDLLRRCLVALCNQDFDRARYEIIVVDDRPSPNTRRVVEELDGRGVTLRYVPVIGRHGPAAARNAGIRQSRGRIVAFTDDDCIPARNWLTAGRAAFVDGVIGAAGKLVVPLPDRPTDYEVNAARLGLARFVTANCFYRKPALVKIGGFDERFSTAWREDSDLYFRLLQEQKPLIEAPEAVVVHPVRPGPLGSEHRPAEEEPLQRTVVQETPGPLQGEPQARRSLALLHHRPGAARLGARFSRRLPGRFPALRISVWFSGTSVFFIRRPGRSSRSLRNIVEMAVTSIVIPPVCIFWRLVGAIRYRVLLPLKGLNGNLFDCCFRPLPLTCRSSRPGPAISIAPCVRPSEAGRRRGSRLPVPAIRYLRRGPGPPGGS